MPRSDPDGDGMIPRRRGSGARRSYYPQSPEQWDELRAKTAQMLADAIANGTHCAIEDWPGIVCPVCRQWVKGVFTKALDASGKDECIGCTASRQGMTIDEFLATLPGRIEQRGAQTYRPAPTRQLTLGQVVGATARKSEDDDDIPF